MELLAHVTELLRGSLDSPWLWVIVFAVSGLDALLPFMPSETTVILVAVLFGADPARLGLLALVAATGAWAGDCLGYAVGHAAGGRALAWLRRGPSGRKQHAWAHTQVQRHAGLLIIAARYLPGGRVASALANGSLGYPFRRFAPLDAAGATLWAVYSVLIGFTGGATFADEPEKGLLLSLALGLGLVGFIEFGRRLRARTLRSSGGTRTVRRGDRQPRRPAESVGAASGPGRTGTELSEMDGEGAGGTPGDGAVVRGDQDCRSGA
ncbi:DedA family protein [Amycolatopsis sp. H20-H5]|uniref:DedA family protein n=1 Tax=Amycolatopsis sp. H20-H5 TaxID=3046309 RepID=UPI002DBFB079|nr:DedA family protein [Amycolatopsis sp. H20-H5]MEC3975371.1 DedA family protein [Amycolatopsis sp. H20-H5]